VLLPAHCAERINNALGQDIDLTYCVHDVLMPVPQLSTVSIHSDGVFDGGGLASVLGNDNDNDNDNVYDTVHVVDIVPIDFDNNTNGAGNSHLCNPNIAHVRVSDFAHDSQCDSVCIEPVAHVDVSDSKVHGVSNVTVSDLTTSPIVLSEELYNTSKFKNIYFCSVSNCTSCYSIRSSFISTLHSSLSFLSASALPASTIAAASSPFSVSSLSTYIAIQPFYTGFPNFISKIAPVASHLNLPLMGELF
jgi:hypothetical protein